MRAWPIISARTRIYIYIYIFFTENQKSDMPLIDQPRHCTATTETHCYRQEPPGADPPSKQQIKQCEIVTGWLVDNETDRIDFLKRDAQGERQPLNADGRAEETAEAGPGAGAVRSQPQR